MTPATFVRHQRQNRKLRQHLRRHFPDAFPPRGAPPLPLAIGIHKWIKLAVMGVFDPADVRRCLKRYTGKPAYLRALAAGGNRVNLSGSSAGKITEEHRLSAADRLWPADRRRAQQAAA